MSHVKTVAPQKAKKSGTSPKLRSKSRSKPQLRTQSTSSPNTVKKQQANDASAVSGEARTLERTEVKSKNGTPTSIASSAVARARSLGFGKNEARGSGSELNVRARDSGDSIEGEVRGRSSLALQGGNGNDTLRATNVQGKLSLNGGNGNDRLLVGTAGPGSTTQISGGEGDDLAIININQSSSTVMRGDKRIYGPEKGDSTINLSTDIEKIRILQNKQPAARWPQVD